MCLLLLFMIVRNKEIWQKYMQISNMLGLQEKEYAIIKLIVFKSCAFCLQEVLCQKKTGKG